MRDYVSPGLRVVRPDHAFPHMRAGDALHHPWKYLRRDVPHIWYADERYPLMGFLNRDEATLLHNIALQFAGKRALEIGSWLGWSTCHLALAGVTLDVIDPAHDDPEFRAIVQESVERCGVAERVNLAGGRSPETIASFGRKWSLFFIDGEHEEPGPVRDALACLPFAEDDCAFVFHDLAAPAVAAGLRALGDKGFHVVVYQTAQVMALAWRGDVVPVAHVPDPEVAWQMPEHLRGLPVSGVDFALPVTTKYRQLRDVAWSGEPSSPAVCIVTSELIGPFKNGGIGTATTGLAELLAASGLRVAVLYTGVVWAPDVRIEPWRKHYAARGITLEALSIAEMASIDGPVKACGFGVPWLVDQHLRRGRYDIIHFNDCCGEGSMVIAAKKAGLAYRDTLLVVGLHSPSRWVFDLNDMLPSTAATAAYHFAEQLSISGADVLWSPSRYLLDWAASHDFDLPEQTFIQQYVMPPARDAAAPRLTVAHGRTTAPREIVFFGRLEERKGLRLFCNVLHMLRDELAQRRVTVTFLGKHGRCADMPSLDFIRQRSSGWQFPIRIMDDLGQPEALAYLRGGDKLAVMPSPADNSPCTVYEALAAGLPFLAARTGGIPELIADADREHVLFDYTAAGLGDALQRVLAEGAWIARQAVAPDETASAWTAMHAHWKTLLPHAEEGTRWATAAAVIDHSAGDAIDDTLRSVDALSMHIRRVIVINRSGESLPVPSIDLNSDEPEVLERELAAVTEDGVLLLHSGVTLDEAGLKNMMRAFASHPVDGFVPAARITGGWGNDGSPRGVRMRVAPPLGGCAPFSLLEGATFTGAMLVRREVLAAAMRGRALSAGNPFMGIADHCVTGGARIWPYPEVVTACAELPVVRASSLPARIAAYESASPNDRYYMLAAGYAAARTRGSGRARSLALAAVNSGLTPAVRVAAWAMRYVRRWRR